MLQKIVRPDKTAFSNKLGRLEKTMQPKDILADQGLPMPASSTPIPNAVIDDVMPQLSDTEFRILIVVIRQTLGFRHPAGLKDAAQEGQKSISLRRCRDWLTHGQLKARTGRASAAVSRAVDGLVRRNLIEVRTYAGELLLTPQERRRCQGMLFFSLAPRLVQTITLSADQP